MTVELLIVMLVLALATYFSAMSTALLTLSRLELNRQLEPRGRASDADWLVEHIKAARWCTALLRTMSRLGLFVAIIVTVMGVGEEARVEVGPLATSFGIAVLLTWVFTTVLASAIAEHAGASLIRLSMSSLKVVAWLGIPLEKTVGFVDESVRRLTGANLTDPEEAAEAELLRRIEESQLQGDLDDNAAELLENVVEFTTTDATEVMTPRTDIDGIELIDDLPTIRRFIVEVGHSRIPVYCDSLDNIVGILYVKDLLPYLGEDASDFQLEPILRKPIVVPESKNVHDLLTDFQQSEVHMAIVVDEYGGTAGLITIEDVLEELVGEIHDEHEPGDEDEPTVTVLDETRLEVDGRYHIDDLNETIDLGLPEDDDYDTIAGFVLAQLGRVPRNGETFETHNIRFTTLAATPTVIRRLRMERLERLAVEENGEP